MRPDITFRKTAFALLDRPALLRQLISRYMANAPLALAACFGLGEQPHFLERILDEIGDLDYDSIPSVVKDRIVALTKHGNRFVSAAAFFVIGCGGESEYLGLIKRWILNVPGERTDACGYLKFFHRALDDELLNLMDIVLREGDKYDQHVAIQELYFYWNTARARQLYDEMKRSIVHPDVLDLMRRIESQVVKFGQLAPDRH